jgi:hypothetical protein
VADEDLDIYPEGLGLAPLSLKTHVETPEEVATTVAGLAELIEEIPGQARNEEDEARNEEEEPEAEPVPEPVEGPAEEIPDQVGNDEEEPVVRQAHQPVPEPEKVEEIPGQARNEEEGARNEEEEARNEEEKPKKSHRKLWRILLIVLCVVVGLLVIFVLLSRLAPGLVDPLLYSKEELQILRY